MFVKHPSTMVRTLSPCLKDIYRKFYLDRAKWFFEDSIFAAISYDNFPMGNVGRH